MTCWRRLNQWQEQGVWEDIWRTLLGTLLGTLDAQGRREWEKAHLDATFACQSRDRTLPKRGDQAGLTRKGKGAKLMLVADNQGIPPGALVASAQRAETTLAEAALATGTVPRVRGRPHRRPGELVAARGYNSETRILEHSETGCAGGESSPAYRNDGQKAATRQESSGVQLLPSVGSRRDLRLAGQLSSIGG